MRIDVFSLKGGVGKTTLSYLLAHAQAAATKHPVLLIDADLLGTCLGDLVHSDVHWHQTDNLAHLICGRPETLVERLQPNALPVYVHHTVRTGGARLEQPTPAHRDQGIVLIAPSHPESNHEAVDPRILRALVGHETAGGWLSYVLGQVIAATERALTGSLAGVIVDHSPGIAAFQRASLDAIEQDRGHTRRALVVTSRDAVDLQMADRFDVTLGNEGVVWLVNRVGGTAAGWRETLPARIREDLGTRDWFARALPFFDDSQLAADYATTSLRWPPAAGNREALDRLHRALFPPPAGGRS